MCGRYCVIRLLGVDGLTLWCGTVDALYNRPTLIMVDETW